MNNSNYKDAFKKPDFHDLGEDDQGYSQEVLPVVAGGVLALALIGVVAILNTMWKLITGRFKDADGHVKEVLTKEEAYSKLVEQSLTLQLESKRAVGQMKFTVRDRLIYEGKITESMIAEAAKEMNAHIDDFVKFYKELDSKVVKPGVVILTDLSKTGDVDKVDAKAADSLAKLEATSRDLIIKNLRLFTYKKEGDFLKRLDNSFKFEWPTNKTEGAKVIADSIKNFHKEVKRISKNLSEDNEISDEELWKIRDIPKPTPSKILHEGYIDDKLNKLDIKGTIEKLTQLSKDIDKNFKEKPAKVKRAKKSIEIIKANFVMLGSNLDLMSTLYVSNVGFYNKLINLSVTSTAVHISLSKTTKTSVTTSKTEEDDE